MLTLKRCNVIEEASAVDEKFEEPLMPFYRQAPHPSGRVVSVRLDEDTILRLDMLCARTGRSRGVYLREVIRQHLPLLEKEYWHHFVRQVEDQTFDELFQQIVMQAMTDDDDGAE